MENYNSERDYYLDEFSKAMKEYFDYERTYYDYMGQFFSTYLNGVLQRAATKGMNASEWKIVEDMRKELENKRDVFRDAEQKLRLFYKK
jgi:hypothetical protein